MAYFATQTPLVGMLPPQSGVFLLTFNAKHTRWPGDDQLFSSRHVNIDGLAGCQMMEYTGSWAVVPH